VTAAIVFASAVRFLPVGLFLVRGNAEHTDEAHVAQALLSPVFVWVFIPLGILIAAVSIAAVAGRLPPDGKRVMLFDLIAGVVIGTLAWMGFVGPAVLP
jgi:hypothetical protein